MYSRIDEELASIKEAGKYKEERIITTQQSTLIGVTTSDNQFINLCANNYLGLSNNPEVFCQHKQFSLIIFWFLSLMIVSLFYSR